MTKIPPVFVEDLVVSMAMGVRPNGWFIRKIPIKMDDLWTFIVYFPIDDGLCHGHSN